MADKAAAALRKVTKTAGAVDAELASTQEGLLALSQAVANVRQGSVRPRGGGFFGFITNLLGVDRRLIDAMRDLIRPRLRAVPGYSAADIDKLLDAAMIEMMRRRRAGHRQRTVGRATGDVWQPHHRATAGNG